MCLTEEGIAIIEREDKSENVDDLHWKREEL
jgi:hypothetical protein